MKKLINILLFSLLSLNVFATDLHKLDSKNKILKINNSIKTVQDKIKFNQFSYLNVQNMLILDNNIKLEKINKLQKMAIYIENKYDIHFPTAEKIVWFSYKESKQKDIDFDLIISLMEIESSFKVNSLSNRGAIGLFQVMPRYHRNKIKNKDIWSIEDNIKIGTTVLKEYIELSNGDIFKALQRYNGSLFDKKKRYSNKIFKNLDNINKELSFI